MNFSLKTFNFLINRLMSSKKNFCFLLKNEDELLEKLLQLNPNASFLSITPTEDMYLVRDIICAIQNQSINQNLLIISQTDLMTIEQQSVLSSFLDNYSGFLQIIFLSNNYLKNLDKTCSLIDIKTEKSTDTTKKTKSLRELILPYFVNLPQKDEKIILTQIDDIALALQDEFINHTDAGLQKSLITLIDYLTDILSSPIQGQILARAIKWNCYRYLKLLKSQKNIDKS